MKIEVNFDDNSPTNPCCRVPCASCASPGEEVSSAPPSASLGIEEGEDVGSNEDEWEVVTGPIIAFSELGGES